MNQQRNNNPRRNFNDRKKRPSKPFKKVQPVKLKKKEDLESSLLETLKNNPPQDT